MLMITTAKSPNSVLMFHVARNYSGLRSLFLLVIDTPRLSVRDAGSTASVLATVSTSDLKQHALSCPYIYV